MTVQAHSITRWNISDVPKYIRLIVSSRTDLTVRSYIPIWIIRETFQHLPRRAVEKTVGNFCRRSRFRDPDTREAWQVRINLLWVELTLMSKWAIFLSWR